VLAVTLLILALLLLRDLRREAREARTNRLLETHTEGLARIHEAVTPPDAILVGPQSLRGASEAFAADAVGDMIWFNVCLTMFVPQSLFDALLQPAIENPRVTSIQFILDRGEEERWREAVLPKVMQCRGAEKVLDPNWSELQEAVSFILAENRRSGGTEAQLSFWGEPFMARTTRDVPRYVFHVRAHSELIPQLFEMARRYRLGTATRG
jgi:hypothetical protein